MPFSGNSQHISYVNDGTLCAMCQRNNGSWRWAEINLDNYMTINRNGMPSRARQQGTGDFSRRVTNVTVNHEGGIQGNSFNANGNPVEFGTRLDRYISNIDGYLVWTENIVNENRPIQTPGLHDYDL